MEECLRDACSMTWWSIIRSSRDPWPMSLKLYNWRDGKSVINSFTDHQYTERSILQWQTVWLSEENNLCYNNTTLTVSHQFGLSLQQIMDVDEKDQIMMTNVWLNLVISYLVATAQNIQRLARIGWLVASGNRK